MQGPMSGFEKAWGGKKNRKLSNKRGGKNSVGRETWGKKVGVQGMTNCKQAQHQERGVYQGKKRGLVVRKKDYQKRQ